MAYWSQKNNSGNKEKTAMTNGWAVENYNFFKPYYQIIDLVAELKDVNIENLCEVQRAIVKLERLEDLCWNFFRQANTALSSEEVQVLLDLYHRKLTDLKQSEGVFFPEAEKSLKACRNLAVCFLGFASDWYGWFGATKNHT
jgi:hypothetical protein